MSKLPLLVKYGLFIIAMPITLLNVGEKTADLISPMIFHLEFLLVILVVYSGMVQHIIQVILIHLDGL